MRRLPKPPDLRDEVVRLRHSKWDDAGAVRLACNEPETQKWLPLPKPYTAEHARSWCGDLSERLWRSGQGLVVALETSDGLAGSLDVKNLRWGERCAELGYWATPGCRGRGYMTRAVRLITRWMLTDLDFERIELRIASGNVASRRVATRSGFEQEGILRRAGYTHEGQVDLVMYSAIRSDVATSAR